MRCCNGADDTCGLGAELQHFAPSGRVLDAGTRSSLRHKGRCGEHSSACACAPRCTHLPCLHRAQINLAEVCVQGALRHALEQCGDDVHFFNQRVDKDTLARVHAALERTSAVLALCVCRQHHPERSVLPNSQSPSNAWRTLTLHLQLPVWEALSGMTGCPLNKRSTRFACIVCGALLRLVACGVLTVAGQAIVRTRRSPRVCVRLSGKLQAVLHAAK